LFTNIFSQESGFLLVLMVSGLSLPFRLLGLPLPFRLLGLPLPFRLLGLSPFGLRSVDVMALVFACFLPVFLLLSKRLGLPFLSDKGVFPCCSFELS